MTDTTLTAEQLQYLIDTTQHRPQYQSALKELLSFRMARSSTSSGDVERVGIYMASKVKHAYKWSALRDQGLPIVSTWIDEAGEGQSGDLSDLWRRCIHEAATAGALVLYCEPGDVLKGGWVELGAALASGTKVFAIGIKDFTVAHDKRITHCDDLDAAISMAMQTLSLPALTQPASAPQPDWSSDVTPEAVQIMRGKAAPNLDGVDLEQIDPPTSASIQGVSEATSGTDENARIVPNKLSDGQVQEILYDLNRKTHDNWATPELIAKVHRSVVYNSGKRLAASPPPKAATTAKVGEITDASQTITELRGLIDAYWGLAITEGREGREHDTVDGAAQTTRDAIERRLNALTAAQLSPVSAPTDAQVEAAAEVIWNDFFGARSGAWDNPPKDQISAIQTRATARAALLASLTIVSEG